MAADEGTLRVLAGHAPEKAIAGAYYTLRLIRHRARISDLGEGLFVPSVQSEPSTEERDIGLAIIKEIEKAEGLSVLKLSEKKAEEYTLRLSRLIEELANRTCGRNRSEGRRLLIELRSIH